MPAKKQVSRVMAPSQCASAGGVRLPAPGPIIAVVGGGSSVRLLPKATRHYPDRYNRQEERGRSERCRFRQDRPLPNRHRRPG
jgi:hypothetical protein